MVILGVLILAGFLVPTDLKTMTCKCPSCDRAVWKDGYCKTHEPSQQRERRAANPERFKGYSLRRDYGISLGEYEDMLAAQNGMCAICSAADGSERSNNNGSKRLSVDHDHVTGQVRGLLCAQCNQALGCLQDSAELLKRSVGYLEAYAEKRKGQVAIVNDLLDEIKQL